MLSQCPTIGGGVKSFEISHVSKYILGSGLRLFSYRWFGHAFAHYLLTFLDL